MKKTKETLPAIVTMALVVVCTIAAFAIATCCTVWLCNGNPEILPVVSMADFIGVVLIFGLVFVFILLFSTVLLQELSGRDLFDAHKGGAAKYYMLMPEPVLLCHTSMLSIERAEYTIQLRMSLSVQQVEAICNILRRQGSAVYVLDFELPEPIGTTTLKISRKFAKQLLRELRPSEYAVLYWETTRDYMGEDILPQAATYISRTDLRRVEPLLEESSQVRIETYNSERHFVMNAQDVAIWKQQLERENQYIQITI